MAKYIKPTLETKFHIDFSWWQQPGKNLRASLQAHICPDSESDALDSEGKTFDWISPLTGEVFEIDLLWHVLYKNCRSDPDFFDARIPLTTAIFRAFVINNNTPLTPVEIHEIIQKKSPDMILRTIGRGLVYDGIKPVA